MIQLPESIENRLIHAAKDAGKPPAVFLDALLDDYYQDQLDSFEAKAAYLEFIDSGAPSKSLQQVITDNGL